MPTFDEMKHPGTCSVCGEKTDVVVLCSSLGPFSLAYCEKCCGAMAEPYGLTVDFVASVGRWPDNVNKLYQDHVRRILEYHGKSEEEFAKDVDESIRKTDEMFEELLRNGECTKVEKAEFDIPETGNIESF